ncbi:hypothetical protein M9Y10_018763 [Tritrichomonas musculus]|uniref:Uncharacterized protein n=1 Tax=Tritrichomonas musculus TaxID=1915356 RepID=A0ABR2HIX9_9EUKA
MERYNASCRSSKLKEKFLLKNGENMLRKKIFFYKECDIQLNINVKESFYDFVQLIMKREMSEGNLSSRPSSLIKLKNEEKKESRFLRKMQKKMIKEDKMMIQQMVSFFLLKNLLILLKTFIPLRAT